MEEEESGGVSKWGGERGGGSRLGGEVTEARCKSTVLQNLTKYE